MKYLLETFPDTPGRTDSFGYRLTINDEQRAIGSGYYVEIDARRSGVRTLAEYADPQPRRRCSVCRKLKPAADVATLVPVHGTKNLVAPVCSDCIVKEV